MGPHGIAELDREEVAQASNLPIANGQPPMRSWLMAFAAFFAVAAFAFWPTYFGSRGLRGMDMRFHLHAASMFGWCGVLVVQAALIRTRRSDIHRLLGRSSPVLVGFVLLSAIRLKHWRMQGFELDLPSTYSVASVLLQLAAFALLYGLGIHYRRDTNTHSRLMLCTVFPLFAPVTDKLIIFRVPEVYSFIYQATGRTGIPFINLAGFLLADVLLAALLLWDWRCHRSTRPFGIAISVSVAFQTAILLVYPMPAWIAFSRWFANVPIP